MLINQEQPQAAQPQMTQPQTAQPQMTQPQTAQPQMTQPQAAQPQAAQPQMAQPQAVQTQMTQPQAAQPQMVAAPPMPSPMEQMQQRMDELERANAQLSANLDKLVKSTAFSNLSAGEGQQPQSAPPIVPPSVTPYQQQGQYTYLRDLDFLPDKRKE